jgi:hypothetical protein
VLARQRDSAEPESHGEQDEEVEVDTTQPRASWEAQLDRLAALIGIQVWTPGH